MQLDAGLGTEAGAPARRALRVLRVAGTAVLLLSAVMLAIFPTAPVRENVPGFHNVVVGFELASTPEHVFGILGRPGDPRRPEAVARMDRGNRIDFLFLVAYPAFYVGLALLLGAHGAPRGVVALLLVLPGLMAAGDALENRELLRLSGATDPQAMLPPLARLRVFTLLKWYAIYAASGVAAVFIRREPGWWRWSALFFGAGALLALVSVAYLPAIEHGSSLLAIAWILTYLHALRAR